MLGFDGGLMALNDRLKLRSMVVGEKDDRVFVASEEAAIRVMEPDAENIWAPAGGEPVIVTSEGRCVIDGCGISSIPSLRCAAAKAAASPAASASGSAPTRYIIMMKNAA